jgi:hypothetical protein
MAQQPKLSPQQKVIVDAFEEMDSAVKSVNKCFGRLAFVVDQQMLKDAGIDGQLQTDGSVDQVKPAHLRAVEDEEDPAAAIAAAEAALGGKVELN